MSVTALGLLAAGTLLIAALLVVARRHLPLWSRIVGGVLIVLLVVVNGAAWVNRHYGRYPTWDVLLGKRARDDASVDQVTDRRSVPNHGEVIQVHIPGTHSGFVARDAQVYLPPAWFAKPRPRLGALLLLAGSPGSPEDWTQAGIADVTSDAYASLHRGETPVLVMADENGSDGADTECVGASETYLTEDVPAFVAKHYGVPDDRRQWGIGGLSEGGMCGLLLALRHPGAFSTFLDLSGLLGPRSGDSNAVGGTVDDLFHGDQADFDAHRPLMIMARQRYPTLAGWFEVGASDADPLAAQRELVPAARTAGITTCAVEIPGGEHTFQLWAEGFRDALPWIAARLGGKAVPPCP